MLTVVVAGALANKPHNGGEAWVRLSWLLGFRRLGCRIHLLEQIGRAACVDAAGRPCDFADSAALAYFRWVTDQFGLAGSATLAYEGGKQTHGLAFQELLDVASAADLLVNVSGHLTAPALLGRFRRKVYIDIDPGYTQFWHADPATPFAVGGHDFYYTIGENIGSPDCPIPTGGLPWRPVRQPVVLADWPVTPAPDPARFTTVASWRGAFGPVEVAGKQYGVKAHEFRKVVDLPRRAGGARFEIALDIHPADGKDLAALRDYGWTVTDPKAAAGDPDAFRRYVQGSGAEFSVAQGIYVGTNSGWFSDRTVRYLASGRPALVQDTGFDRHLPVGEGLVPFRTPDEAAAGADRIVRNYPAHALAARRIAEEYFDSDKVLGWLLANVN